MGRAGGGSRGGGFSGGGHSSGRAGGGHRMSSSSRAGSGRSSFGGGGSHHSYGRGPGMGMGPGPGPGPRHHGPGWGGYYHHPPYRRRRSVVYRSGVSSLASLLVALVIIFVIFSTFFPLVIGGTIGVFSGEQSTIEREKLDSGVGFVNDCVTDELGWIDNESKTEAKLKEFYEETGVQPAVYLKDYDAELTTDELKGEWAQAYYEDTFDAENVFLFVYFAEEDTDNDVGYMYYVAGKQATSVMDSEAVEIFWNQIDRNWYSDMSTDDVFIESFNDTADIIMHVSTTSKDITKYLIIGITVIVALFAIIHIMKTKRKNEQARAQETKDILNTPLEDLVDEALNKTKEE